MQEKTNLVQIRDTQNANGFFHQKTETIQKFLIFCSGLNNQSVVLDVGAGDGVATLPALEQGVRVLAMDKEIKHLEEIETKNPIRGGLQLQTIHGAFPEALAEIDEPLNAVLMSFVMGFLSPNEISRGLLNLFDLMAPGGKIFIVHYTPYTKVTQKFLPEYERRMRSGHPWPGLCEDLEQWCDEPGLLHNLPNTLNLMDFETLCRELVYAGFRMLSCRYYGGEAVEEKYRLGNGLKTWVEAIAEKPSM